MGIVYEIILDTSAERIAKDIVTYDATPWHSEPRD